MFSVRNELFGVNEVNWKWLKQEVEVAETKLENLAAVAQIVLRRLN